MANPNDHRRRQPEPPSESRSPAAVWDCGSALYDSVELSSFQRRLESAIVSSRTLSMPHRRTSSSNGAKIRPPVGSKLSRSFQKLLRSVFSHAKHKPDNGVVDDYAGQKKLAENDVVYKELGEDVAVPAPERRQDSGKVSPESRRVVGKSVSERFTAVSLTTTKIISSFA